MAQEAIVGYGAGHGQTIYWSNQFNTGLTAREALQALEARRGQAAGGTEAGAIGLWEDIDKTHSRPRIINPDLGALAGAVERAAAEGKKCAVAEVEGELGIAVEGEPSQIVREIPATAQYWKDYLTFSAQLRKYERDGAPAGKEKTLDHLRDAVAERKLGLWAATKRMSLADRAGIEVVPISQLQQAPRGRGEAAEPPATSPATAARAGAGEPPERDGESEGGAAREDRVGQERGHADMVTLRFNREFLKLLDPAKNRGREEALATIPAGVEAGGQDLSWRKIYLDVTDEEQKRIISGESEKRYAGFTLAADKKLFAYGRGDRVQVTAGQVAQGMQKEQEAYLASGKASEHGARRTSTNAAPAAARGGRAKRDRVKLTFPAAMVGEPATFEKTVPATGRTYSYTKCACEVPSGVKVDGMDMGGRIVGLFAHDETFADIEAGNPTVRFSPFAGDNLWLRGVGGEKARCIEASDLAAQLEGLSREAAERGEGPAPVNERTLTPDELESDYGAKVSYETADSGARRADGPDLADDDIEF